MGLKARRSDLFSDAHSINQRGSISTLRYQLFGGFFAFSYHTRVLLWEKRVADVSFKHHCNLNHPILTHVWPGNSLEGILTIYSINICCFPKGCSLGNSRLLSDLCKSLLSNGSFQDVRAACLVTVISLAT